MLAGRSLQTSFMSSRENRQQFMQRRRFLKTYVNGNTNNRPRNMGYDSKYGNLGIFLPTWYGGGCHACLRDNNGFHRDWLCCEGSTESVPQQARLNSFMFICRWLIHLFPGILDLRPGSLPRLFAFERQSGRKQLSGRLSH